MKTAGSSTWITKTYRALLMLAGALTTTGCQLEDLNIYLRDTMYPSPGVVTYQALALERLPRGVAINAAGGNLILQRTDLSVDTLLGPLPITATFNSSEFRWHYSYDLHVHYDGTFVDGTGARHKTATLANGARIPGTQWVKVHSNAFRTLGGMTHEFSTTTGYLTKVYWGTDDKIRLEYSQEWSSICGGNALVIDQCTDTLGCGDTPYVVCTSNPTEQPWKIRNRAGDEVYYALDTDATGTWLEGVDRDGAREVSYDVLLNGGALPGNKTLFHANGMRLRYPEGDQITFDFENMPGGPGDRHRRILEVDYGGGSVYTIQYNFSYADYLAGTVDAYCQIQNCTTPDPALEDAAVLNAIAWITTEVSGHRTTKITDPYGEDLRVYWNAAKRLRRIRGWGREIDYEWYESGFFKNLLFEEKNGSAGPELRQWTWTGGGIGNYSTMVETLNGQVQATTHFEPFFNSFYDVNAPSDPLVQEIRDPYGAIIVSNIWYFGPLADAEDPSISGHGVRFESMNGTFETTFDYYLMLEPPYSSASNVAYTAEVQEDGARYWRGLGWNGKPEMQVQRGTDATGTWRWGNYAHREYDPAGNLLRATPLPAGASHPLHPTYMVPATPNSGGVTRWGYDAQRRMTTIELSDSACGSNIISLSYRNDGQMDYVDRPCGGDTDFIYDSRGRLSQRRERVDGAWKTFATFGYDDAFRQTSWTLGNGISRTTSYQDYRVSQETHASPSGVTTLEYDYNSSDQLDDISSGSFTESYDYDNLNRLDRVDFADGASKSISYDLRNRPISVTYTHPGGQTVTVTQSFDNADRVTGLWVNGQPLLTTGYNTRGQVDFHSFGNGLTREFGYNELGVLWFTNGKYTPPSYARNYNETTTSVGHVRELSEGAGTWEDLQEAPSTWDVTFDSGFTYTATTEMSGGDQDRRLSQFAGDIGQHYDYTAFSDCTLSSTWNAEQNRLQSHDGVTYAYDDAGFVTSRSGKAMTYNGYGQLLSYGNDITIDYDPLGRPSYRNYSGEIKRWCAGGEIECDGFGNWEQIDLDVVVADLTASGDHLYRHSDWRGNTLFTSNQAGIILSQYQYSGYRIWASQGSHSDRESRFAGGIDLDEIMIVGARVYDPAAGRFLAPDPAFNPVNQYAYTQGNPIEFQDLTGLQSNYHADRLNENLGKAVKGYLPGSLTQTWADNFPRMVDEITNDYHWSAGLGVALVGTVAVLPLLAADAYGIGMIPTNIDVSVNFQYQVQPYHDYSVNVSVTIVDDVNGFFEQLVAGDIGPG